MTDPPRYDLSEEISPRDLHYFVAVAEAGQISRAAKRLYIAQPALSQAISRLERRLGLELLHRHPRGVTLTPAGRIIFEKATVAVKAGAEALATARSLSRGQGGVLELGFLSSPPPLLAPGPLEVFRAGNPGARVCFRELGFPVAPITDWLSEVDLALCYACTPRDGVEVMSLWIEPRAVLLHSGHRLAGRGELLVSEVLDETFYGNHPATDPAWARIWSLDDHRGEPPLHVTEDTPANALEMVAAITAGHAVTAVPNSVAETIASVAPSLSAQRLSDAAPVTCGLVWRAEPTNPLTAAFVDATRAFLEAAGAQKGAPVAGAPAGDRADGPSPRFAPPPEARDGALARPVSPR
jgi:DNA-binding transcriptional LysR family regulator